jgi:hypothetical protein
VFDNGFHRKLASNLPELGEGSFSGLSVFWPLRHFSAPVFSRCLFIVREQESPRYTFLSMSVEWGELKYVIRVVTGTCSVPSTFGFPVQHFPVPLLPCSSLFSFSFGLVLFVWVVFFFFFLRGRCVVITVKCSLTSVCKAIRTSHLSTSTHGSEEGRDPPYRPLRCKSDGH